MSQAGFLQALQDFPKDTINEEMVELMEPYFKAEDYSMENAKRVKNMFIAFCWSFWFALHHGIVLGIVM